MLLKAQEKAEREAAKAEEIKRREEEKKELLRKKMQEANETGTTDSPAVHVQLLKAEVQRLKAELKLAKAEKDGVAPGYAYLCQVSSCPLRLVVQQGTPLGPLCARCLCPGRLGSPAE